jgi:hypothetical protein
VSFAVTDGTPDNFQLQMSPATQLSDADLLSGPNPFGQQDFVADWGRLGFQLLENSDYVFRRRNKIWIYLTASFMYSLWVQFSFHTPTFDLLHPASPQNVRVVQNCLDSDGQLGRGSDRDSITNSPMTAS